MRGETITIIRRGTQTSEDAHGRPVYATSPVTVPGCAFAPGSTGEDGATFGARIATGGTVYAPKGTVFEPTDILTIRGIDYVVDGEPAEWRSPFNGRTRGVVVNVKRGA